MTCKEENQTVKWNISQYNKNIKRIIRFFPWDSQDKSNAKY